MLEIKNLTKVYRSKTGEEVRALDNVSISFPESGMVFILGKSGSGKSTLLNVMGGLDSYDEGEFIIKGKSSKDFGGSDFDAYRNTFIGFIFQEYNVLDDFTVGANIGLALELQGKKATAEKINEILGQVDLLNYAKRKPNELSGGQKQRVAIARALVKEPQIIMADEPTGALDSNTGKQIFDTLKALSKEKLVLIVSHDRDFAERYADRIIELSDGRILSDVTKHEHESEKLSDGVDRINHNIFRIKGGYRLTAADLEMINAYLSENSADVILSGDGRINDELRSAAGISEKGTTAVFEGTEAEKDYTLKKYEKKDSKFIRSRLPAKNALRIGASGLKHKKFRLIMTILLSLVAFALFGFADTAAGYDKITATFDSILDSNVKNASLTVGVRHTYHYDDGDSRTNYQKALLNDDDIEWLRNQTGMDFVPVYTGSLYSDGGFSISSMMKQYESNTVYTGKMAGLVAMSEESLAKTGFAVTGRLPAAKGEIAITELTYRQLNEYGFTNTTYREEVAAGSLTMDDSKNGILGKHITLSSRDRDPGMGNTNEDPYTFVIVGVVDTGFDYDRYHSFLPKDKNATGAPMMEEEGNALTDMVLMGELESELGYGFHSLGFVVRESVDVLSALHMSASRELGTPMNGWNGEMYVVVKTPSSSEGGDGGMEKKDMVISGVGTDVIIMGGSSSGDHISRVAGSSALSKLKVTWLDGERTTLGANEVVIPSRLITSQLPQSTKKNVDHAALTAMVAEKYPNGLTAWNEADESLDYTTRLGYAAVVDYITGAVAAADDTAIDIAFNDWFSGDATGYDLAAKREYVKREWLSMWLERNETWRTPNGFADVKDYYRVTSEEAMATVSGYYFDFYGIRTLVDALNAAQKEQLMADIRYEIESCFREVSQKNSEKTINASSIREIMHKIEGIKVVVGGELWENQSYVDLMTGGENPYITLTEWENLGTEQEKQSRAMYFYRDWYLNNSNWGYEQNDFGGKSGREIEDEAETLWLNLLDFDMSTLVSGITFERFERNYMDGTESSKGALPYVIVGYYDSDAYSHGDMLISDTLMETYETWAEEQAKNGGYHEDIAEHEEGQWSFVIAPMPTDHDTLLKLVQMSYDETGDLRFELQNAVMNTLGSFNNFIEEGAKIFLYIGIGFAVFSALLLMNFIATSISYKKREIGVLRAVGARSSDVFKIFFSEALLIAAINFILAVAAVITAIFFVNDWMRDSGITITLLSFGVRQVILMMLVSVGVALLSSFLPVYNIARRKPIDAIRDK